MILIIGNKKHFTASEVEGQLCASGKENKESNGHIRSKATRGKKRHRPRALQEHLQQTTNNREPRNSLVDSVGNSCALALRWTSAGGRAWGAAAGARELCRGRGSVADEFALDDAGRTSLALEPAAVNLSSALDRESSKNTLQGRQLWCCEVSREEDGTADGLQGWETDSGQGTVVGNVVGASNGLQHREGNVLDVLVAGQSETSGCASANRSQVRGGELSEEISVQAESSIDSL